MVAALIIFAAQFMDYWWKAKWKVKLVSLALFPLPFGFLAKELYARIAEDRDILTLGSRTLIWDAFIQHITENPNGIDSVFGSTLFPVTEHFHTNNCHNVFLNHMFRFSIPVGVIFSIIFLVIILFSLIKNFSFLTLGIWVALLIPMTMDYALFTSELPFLLFVLYCMFFRKKVSRIPFH